MAENHQTDHLVMENKPFRSDCGLKQHPELAAPPSMADDFPPLYSIPGRVNSPNSVGSTRLQLHVGQNPPLVQDAPPPMVSQPPVEKSFIDAVISQCTFPSEDSEHRKKTSTGMIVIKMSNLE
ncbi:UNVERIFIED_CONTAM: hypothetical protein Sradi_3017700 [Sesamum radiatum]|uniref:Uncharacterized protein n=1 Tax=Sesamum radiatum TaxID=300843 RepID=A0AAW2S1D6_SESRA